MSDVTVDTRARERLPLGWWGMAMVIATEGALFAVLVSSYFYLRFKNAHWPPPGTPEPKLLVPLILLGVLVASAAPVWVAARSATPRRWLALALLLQAGYFAMEVQLFSDDLHRFTPQQHAYGSLYYTLLGADHAHVALGILLDLWLLWKLLGGMTTYRRNALRAVSLYWAAVAVLTVVVTLTVLSPGFS